MANNNIPTGYIPNRPMKEIEQDFKKGGIGTIDDFINNNFTQETSNVFGNIPITQTPQNQLKSISFQYLNDDGTGRIGNGVLSLEAITKVLKGVPAHSLTLFDQVIYTDPSIFYSNDITVLRNAVYTNLGIDAFVPSAQAGFPASIIDLNIIVDTMIKSMKNFTFTYDGYINPALSASKAVVQAAINFNGV